MDMIGLALVLLFVMLLGCAWALCRAAARGEWPIDRSEYIESTLRRVKR